MKAKFTIVIALLVLTSSATAQELGNNSSSKTSSSKSFPPKVESLQTNESQDFDRTESGNMIDVNGAAKSEAERKKSLEAMGYSYMPPQEGIKDYVEDYFSIPENEGLVGCVYTKGFSYPSICGDRKGKVIFDVSKHSQKTLDKIIASQGKKGKYNKIPGGGPIKFSDDELP